MLVLQACGLKRGLGSKLCPARPSHRTLLDISCPTSVVHKITLATGPVCFSDPKFSGSISLGSRVSIVIPTNDSSSRSVYLVLTHPTHINWAMDSFIRLSETLQQWRDFCRDHLINCYVEICH